MEQEKSVSTVRDYEKNLGVRVSELRSLLTHHSETIAAIHQKYENDKAAAENKLARTLNDIETRYTNEVNNTNASYRARVENLENQHKRKSSQANDATSSVFNRNNDLFDRALALRRDWGTYIDKVQGQFTQAVDKAKKERADALRRDWEELYKRKNQLALGVRGRVKYKRTSPFWYAFWRPFAVTPEWLIGPRTIAIIFAILWIVILVCMCMWDAFWYRDTSSVMSSSFAFYGLLAVAGYFLMEYIFCFHATFSAVRRNNADEKNKAEAKNNSILSDKANAAERLEAFEQQYKPYFYHDGKWDFSGSRYRMSRAEADKIMNNVKAELAHYKPEQFQGISGYEFKINYEAL